MNLETKSLHSWLHPLGWVRKSTKAFNFVPSERVTGQVFFGRSHQTFRRGNALSNSGVHFGVGSVGEVFIYCWGLIRGNAQMLRASRKHTPSLCDKVTQKVAVGSSILVMFASIHSFIHPSVQVSLPSNAFLLSRVILKYVASWVVCESAREWTLAVGFWLVFLWTYFFLTNRMLSKVNKDIKRFIKRLGHTLWSAKCKWIFISVWISFFL